MRRFRMAAEIVRWILRPPMGHTQTHNFNTKPQIPSRKSRNTRNHEHLSMPIQHYHSFLWYAFQAWLNFLQI